MTDLDLDPDLDLDTDPDLDPDLDLDLTPLAPAGAPDPTRRAKARLRNGLIMTVMAGVMGFVLYQAITSARVYFYNVDEAIALREETGDQTIRMQGTVLSEDGVDAEGNLLFTLIFAGETAEVRHTGDEPSNLFAVGEKVVAEGKWEGETFVSHQVVIKHSEEYIEDNGDRLDYEVDLPAEE
ncbi:MAG: cytochrome c maturation protein CcmE [Actinomycetota bacterium]